MSEEDWRRKAVFAGMHLELLGPREFDRSSFNDAFGNENIAAARLFFLLADDLDGLEVAMADLERTLAEEYRIAAMVFEDPPRRTHARISWTLARHRTHHAKVFVCIMRRFWRLLDTAYNERASYPRRMKAAVEIAWRQNRFFFGTYIASRDAIEHVDSKVGDGRRRIPESFTMGKLHVIEGAACDVTPKALQVAIDVWEALAKAANQEGERVFGSMLWRARLLRAMRYRAESR
ncbi:MAG TPA: hypothetical protein VH062_10190 [Polyangiaceae bacterium]|jgi:hypothetical protein|nr:hypothetical protein [Polyangiaceae bacterium]